MSAILGPAARLQSKPTIVGATGKTFDALVASSTPSNLASITQLMHQYAPMHTLEIGLGPGASCAVFAALHQELHPHSACSHIAIDPFQSSIWDNLGTLKLRDAGVPEYVEVLEERSCAVLPRLLASGRRFGIIYIDGSHLFEDVFVDAYYSVRLLENGGHLLFDDSSMRHVAKVLAFIDASLPGLKKQPARTLKQAVAAWVGRRQLTVYRRDGGVERAWDSPFQRF